MKHIGLITQVERGHAGESTLGTRNLNKVNQLMYHLVLFKFAVDIVNYSSLSSPLSLQSKYQLHIYRFSFYLILFKLILKCKFKCIQNYIIILCIIQQVERGYAGESSIGTRKLNKLDDVNVLSWLIFFDWPVGTCIFYTQSVQNITYFEHYDIILRLFLRQVFSRNWNL